MAETHIRVFFVVKKVMHVIEMDTFQAFDLLQNKLLNNNAPFAVYVRNSLDIWVLSRIEESDPDYISAAMGQYPIEYKRFIKEEYA